MEGAQYVMAASTAARAFRTPYPKTLLGGPEAPHWLLALPVAVSFRIVSVAQQSPMRHGAASHISATVAAE